MELSQAIANASFNDLYQIAREAKEGITFWGYRYIYLLNCNYKGVVHINTLALRVMELDLASAGSGMPPSDSQIGIEVVKRVKHIFKMNDDTFKQKNFLTRIMCSIRDLFIAIRERNEYPKGFRFEWKDRY